MEKFKVLATGRIGTGGRTTVPKQVEEALNAKEGTILLWGIDEKGKVVVKKAE